ncbi:MAG: FAD-dependent oxidoreductase [Mariniblastus sp.]
MLDSLPEHLRERSRIIVESTEVSPDHPFVLYWMRNAVRSDENSALDVARHLADQQGIPLLVYQAISPHYQFASDRHHTFMLQGARDVQNQFSEIGISYAFHLATEDDNEPHLVTLAKSATVVVTEDMPVDPAKRFLNALEDSTNVSIVCVDTACVAPMHLVKKAFTRAFKFRSATKKLYEERLTKAWPPVEAATKSFDLQLLPFKPLDLQSFDIADLVAQCQIDHSVGPVVDTIGGSTAGYARWNEFKKNKLSSYAKQRNDALQNGVSRMSAYLHYGMVSPFRLARESANIDNAGAEKFLDELLIWRELAYAFCFHRPDHDQWSAIPEWARETLVAHADDSREQVYSWEQLARGKTDNAFWNAAQKSLLMQGELHNNVRMTWGKAILNWKQTPQEALDTIVDLNHRYALDGRDPCSYGGILWCLGQFDRPFEPEKNIVGLVRPRSTKQHASRLDTNKYLAKVASPRFSPTSVAIIGAGISGLIAARTLKDHGVSVTVFDKSRGVGGRMATRRIEEGSFDHGAQYFTARDPRFKRYVDSWIQQSVVGIWPTKCSNGDQKIVVLENGIIQSESKSQTRYVGVPTMNAICKHLADGIEIKKQVRIKAANRINDGPIEVFDEDQNSVGKFDRLIVSAPAEQSAEILAEFPSVANKISKVKMNPCWASMVAFDSPVTDAWVGAFLHESFLTWTARNSTKPGRDSNREHLVIHACPEWTAEHWEEDAGQVGRQMLAEFWRVTGLPAMTPTHMQSHRWKYAIAAEPANAGYFCDDDSIVFACGDWAKGSRVEGAFLSGMSAAGRVLGSLSLAERLVESNQALLF